MKRIVAFFITALLIISMLSQTAFGLTMLVGTEIPQIKSEISENKWYHDAVEFVFNEYLFLGDNKGHPVKDEAVLIDSVVFDFAPNKVATRMELLSTLYLYDGNNDYFNSYPFFLAPLEVETAIPDPFKDVSDGTWDAVAAQWGYDNGITNGAGGGRFKPHSNVTREEFVTMVYRFAQKKGVDTSTSDGVAKAFDDYGKVSKWARDAMDWACDIGLINGKTKTMIKPRDSVTRAEMAMIIYRFNNLVIAHDDLCPELQ